MGWAGAQGRIAYLAGDLEGSMTELIHMIIERFGFGSYLKTVAKEKRVRGDARLIEDVTGGKHERD